MSDIKLIIAKNIYDLRVARGMTQLELAEKLHYSDKSVSKWEKGDSLPEISTLVTLMPSRQPLSQHCPPSSGKNAVLSRITLYPESVFSQDFTTASNSVK